jgi:hypothetical protein
MKPEQTVKADVLSYRVPCPVITFRAVCVCNGCCLPGWCEGAWECSCMSFLVGLLFNWVQLALQTSSADLDCDRLCTLHGTALVCLTCSARAGSA